ncbi:LANO_0G02652g1_1 [Lachancea nothofagi CBS 11611]|uniref:Peptidyl-prolyl cis-trans isomerase n=1 Tax=Lachancea nothofagi CBS 11611 TaxID=1266666 RepID=A0A1G4KFB3_9SACH|nr:LANO_0G02652g1_1 [Lachancea nothofagi CBS 11611]
MSVLLETTRGDLVLDLDCETYPVETFNFLKLCKSDFYQYQCFYNLNKDYSIECGDAVVGNRYRETLRFHNTSIQGLVGPKDQVSGRLVKSSQVHRKSREAQVGDVAFLTSLLDDTTPLVGSRFMISLAESAESYTDVVVFGKVTLDGLDTLRDWNAQTVDNEKRPEVDIRIKKAHVLHDPYPDPDGFNIFEFDPPKTDVRLPPSVIAAAIQEHKEHRLERDIRSKELTLEILGDIPHVGIKPSDRVLFICKLNSLTRAKDLAVIFHRFGEIDTIEIVYDKELGTSLCYGFIEFADKISCEKAYSKMDGVLIDDRRIHVDFCQSSKKLDKW